MDILTDPTAERAILSGCIKYGADTFVEVEDLVTERTFTVDSNQIWYKCVKHILSEDSEAKLDVPSLLSAANSLGLKDQVSSKEEQNHLRAILNLPVEKANVRKLAAKVRKLEIARAGLDVNRQIEEGLMSVTGDEPIASILNLLENPVFEFSLALNNNDEAPKNLGEDMQAYVEYLAANPIKQVGLPTGYKLLDTAIGGGLRKGGVTTVGARSGIGKSTYGMNVGLNLACGFEYEYGKFNKVEPVPVLYLDTEMGSDDHKLKNLANISNVVIDNIETGQFGLKPDELNRVREAAKKLENIPYDVKSIAGQPFEETLAIMRRWIKKRVGLDSNGKAKNCLIIFDYIKLMDSSGLSSHLTEFQALGFIMTGLHNFAVKYQIPILCFVQLNRDGIDKEDASATSGSDRIVWLTSNLIYYKPQDDEELANQPKGKRYTHKFVIVKQRHGKGLKHKDYINLLAEGQYGRITEGPLSSELTKPTDPLKTEIKDNVKF